MKYNEKINKLLVPKKSQKIMVLDLFAGSGGLSLGFEAVGFKTKGYEMDKDCCKTYNENLYGTCYEEFLSPEFNFPKAEVIIGGPPCQPFSVRGRQKGLKDSRDGFPSFIAAVKKIRPKIFIIENVKGIIYKNKEYLHQIISDLKKEGYIVEYKILKASDYGVPQNRERIIIVGHNGSFKFPIKKETKIGVGVALENLEKSEEEPRYLTKSMDEYIAKYEKASKCVVPRDLHMDKPARTLTVRNLVGATSDMHRIKMKNGKRRRIYVNEAARLQSFPDWFKFSGNRDSALKQIGNAVAPLFAYELALAVKTYINSKSNFNLMGSLILLFL
jgi:DNA (cytosine-5)-methyltransferase 1|tara:strand:- start:1251 stop:2240 length:990 start_codon:yes stop_codon:yes gene_type:complete